MKQGWEIKQLGDVCDKASSNVSQNQLDNEVGDYPIFGASGLIKNVSFYHQAKPYLSIVKDGSGVGRVTKMDAYTSVIGTLQYILPNEGIDLDYLNYSLMSIDFKKYVAGAAIPHIYFKDYKNEPFLWMPLSEQQQIVSVLNKAFGNIAKAKANAEQNLKNAKELFESYLQGVFENKGEGWENTQLSKLCLPNRIITYGVIKLGDDIEDGVPCLRTSNVRWLRIDLTGMKRILPELSKEYSRTILEGGEVLVNVRGTLGGVAVVPKTMTGWNVSREVAVVPIDSNKIDPFFISTFIGSETAQKWLGDVKKGAAYVGINIEDLRLLPIPLPKLKEQQAIVQKLDALSAETKKLEAIYQQKINDLEELKKSVLQKAFAGELKPEKAVAL